jgi:hypothetical protein
LLLAQLFGRTPESSRVIAVLHYLDGLTLEEVAKEVGVSVSGVRKRLRVLRQELTILEKGVANRSSPILREINELLIVNGESIEFEPTGVTRVAVEESKLLQTQGGKEGITFTGMMPGITGMQVHTKDAGRAAYVRVSDAYPDDLLAQMQTDLEPSIKSCVDEHGPGTLHARVLIDRGGVVLKMLWDPQTEGSDALLNCAAESIQAREFPVREPGEVTIARFKW